MRVSLAAVIGIGLVGTGWAVPSPMNARDVALMIRMGVPEVEVVAELEKRRFAVALDGEAEKILRQSATPETLIARLKAGNFMISAEGAAVAAQQRALQQANEAKRVAEEAALGARRNELIAEGNAAMALNGKITGMISGKLVRLSGDTFQSLGGNEFSQVRWFVIYRAAQWDANCRKFTPKLVEFYQRMKSSHPEFEVIFASADRDEFNMGNYMRAARMPWPALRYESRDIFGEYCGTGAPWLVVVDERGRALTKNGIDKQFLDPSLVLETLEREILR